MAGFDANAMLNSSVIGSASRYAERNDAELVGMGQGKGGRSRGKEAICDAVCERLECAVRETTNKSPVSAFVTFVRFSFAVAGLKKRGSRPCAHVSGSLPSRSEAMRRRMRLTSLHLAQAVEGWHRAPPLAIPLPWTTALRSGIRVRLHLARV